MSNKIGKVLVIGGSGRFAGLVVPALAEKGIESRVLVRSQPASNRASLNGAAEIALGDLRDTGSLADAVRGVQGVFHIGPAFAPDETRLGLNLLEAARQAGVAKFVYSSVIQPTYVKLPNHAAKVPVEEAIFESGIEYTILRPTNFFQNLTGAWPGIVRNQAFGEPFPKTARVARVDYRDVADAVAIAFSEDRLGYGAFDLCADGSPSRQDIVAIISDVIGKKVAALEPTFEEWVAAAKLPYSEEQLVVLRQVHAHYAAHGSPGNSLTLHAVLGRAPRTLRRFIEELAGRGVVQYPAGRKSR